MNGSGVSSDSKIGDFNDSIRQLLLSVDLYDKTVLNMMLIPF